MKTQAFNTGYVPALGSPPINALVWVNVLSCPFDTLQLRFLVAVTKPINITLLCTEWKKKKKRCSLSGADIILARVDIMTLI